MRPVYVGYLFMHGIAITAFCYSNIIACPLKSKLKKKLEAYFLIFPGCGTVVVSGQLSFTFVLFN
jgi:hypothetical protein